MVYMAVFNDGKVSDSYTTAENLERSNAWRMRQLYMMVGCPTSEGLNLLVKNALAGLKARAKLPSYNI